MVNTGAITVRRSGCGLTGQVAAAVRRIVLQPVWPWMYTAIMHCVLGATLPPVSAMVVEPGAAKSAPAHCLVGMAVGKILNPVVGKANVCE